MPYATPSPSTSPTTTTVSVLPSPPRSGSSTPSSRASTNSANSPPNGRFHTYHGASATAARIRTLKSGRNHVRSYSHDAVVHSPPPADEGKGYIFVKPTAGMTASPDADEDAFDRPAASASSSRPSKETQPIAAGPSSAPPPRHRRPRIPTFTVGGSQSDGVEVLDFVPPSGSSSAPLAGPAPIAASAKRPLHQKARSEVSNMRIELEGLAELHDDPYCQTPMLRKKSGELVRSSLKSGDPTRRAMRAKSAPATPTGPKYVHFDSHLEHVKHFLSQQRPTAVSRDGSPIDTETEGEDEFPFPAMVGECKVTLRMPNFPVAPDTDGKNKDVYLRSLDLSEDSKSMRGVVQVKNLSFHKWIAIRFTFDSWQTVSEVSGEYLESVAGGVHDRFSFSIKLQDMLARIEDKTMFLAVRYTTDGQEIWDNNGGPNYHIGFKKHETRAAAPASSTKKEGYQWSVTTAGQASSRMAELRAELNRLVGDDLGLDIPQPTFKNPGISARPAAPGVFSSRYDFGTSLKQVSGGRYDGSPRGSPTTELPRVEAASKSGGGLAFPTTFIGGMPATSTSPAGPSPLGRTVDLPAFVAPYVPASQRPPSPPEEADDNTRSAFPHAVKMATQPPSPPQSQTHKPGTRFFSFPPTRSGIPSLFANGAANHKASGGLARPQTHSPSLSPAMTPIDSPASNSPPQRHQLTLVNTGLPSPSPSESGPSSPETGSQESPASPPYIMDQLPPHEGARADMSSASYADFVQNFCFGGGGGALGLSIDPEFGYERCATALTPRSASPIPPEALDARNFFRRSSSPFVAPAPQPIS